MAFGSKFDMSAAEDSIETGVSYLECKRRVLRCEIRAARDSVYSETGRKPSSPLFPPLLFEEMWEVQFSLSLDHLENSYPAMHLTHIHLLCLSFKSFLSSQVLPNNPSPAMHETNVAESATIGRANILIDDKPGDLSVC